jgi:Protein kinase domain
VAVSCLIAFWIKVRIQSAMRHCLFVAFWKVCSICMRRASFTVISSLKVCIAAVLYFSHLFLCAHILCSRGVFFFIDLLLATVDDDFDIRIADFGLSKIIGSTTLIQSLAGSPNYVAPEVLDGLGYREWADMWSVGVITYILLCGYPPFACEDTRDLLEMIQNADYEYDEDYWDEISDLAKNFVDGLLNLDHNARLTAHDALRHPWLARNAADTAESHPLDIRNELTRTISEWKQGSGGSSASGAHRDDDGSASDAASSSAGASSAAAAAASVAAASPVARGNATVVELTRPAPAAAVVDDDDCDESTELPIGSIESLRIARVRTPSVSFYIFLYTELGGADGPNGSQNFLERRNLSAAQLRQVIRHDDVALFVAYADGNPVAFCELDLRDSTQRDGDVQIKHVAVQRAFERYLNVSATLISTAVHFALSRPSTRRLYASSSSHRTLSLLESAKFQVV